MACFLDSVLAQMGQLLAQVYMTEDNKILILSMSSMSVSLYFQKEF